MSDYGALTVWKSALVPKGTFIWRKGKEVIGVTKLDSDRTKFFGMFGLGPEAPPAADGVVMSPDDYLLVSEASTA